MYIILLGPPGSGKGTQAKLLEEKLNIPHISTGDLFREEFKKNTELGKRINTIMESGNLVDDETTIKTFEKRLTQKDCQKGAILDGIPRTINQAKLLINLFNKMNLKLDTVIHIELPEKENIYRISKRWTCQKNGHIFHEKYKPPKVTGICDIDGSPLYQRDDQKPEVVRERLNVYRKSTEPLINFYKKEGLLITINGNQSIEKTHQEILTKLSLKHLL